MTSISNKSNSILDFIERHKFWTALILCAVFSFVYLTANGFYFVSGNDDYCIFNVIYGGNTAIPCVGYFYTSLSVLLQPLFGKINAYMTMQLIICFLSLVAIDYYFIAKLGAKKGLFYTAFFNAIFLSFLIITVFYTFSAIIVSTSGLLCLIYGSIFEHRRGFKNLQIISGFLLVLLGSQFRFQPFEACCAICAVFATSMFISSVVKNIKQNVVKKPFASAFKKYAVTGMLLAAAVVSAFGVNALSETLKKTDDSYNEISEYYQALSSVTDVPASFFYYNADEFEKLGLKSKADLQLLKTWYVDDSFFTVEKLNAIAECMKDDLKDGLLNKNIFEKIIYPFSNTISVSLQNGSIFVYLFAFILLVFGSIIISLLFPKIRGLLLRLLSVSVLWSLFFVISDVFKTESVLLLPLMVVSIIISFRYNSFQAVTTIFLIAALLCLYSYLVALRLIFHAVFSSLFPTFVFMVFGINGENRIVLIKRISLKRTAFSLAAVLLAAVSAISVVSVFTEIVYVEDKNSNPLLDNYIDDHPEKVFLINEMDLKRQYYNPLVLPDEKTNTVDYGLWLTKANCYKHSREINGIDNMFKDSINSNMLIVIYECIDDSANNVLSGTAIDIYYNNHYAENGEHIALKLADRAGNYSFYEVVTEKAAAQ